MPGTIIKDCVFSVKAYCKTLEEKGGNVEAFDTTITEKFPKATKGSWYMDPKVVEITHVMLVVQRPNGVNMQDDDEDGFGCPGLTGLSDLHSQDALNWAKLTLPSGMVDTNFCLLCPFWATNNKALNNHVHKHYGMDLTCHKDGYMMASMAAMRIHMEGRHGLKSNHVVKKKKAVSKT